MALKKSSERRAADKSDQMLEWVHAGFKTTDVGRVLFAAYEAEKAKCLAVYDYVRTFYALETALVQPRKKRGRAWDRYEKAAKRAFVFVPSAGGY